MTLYLLRAFVRSVLSHPRVTRALVRLAHAAREVVAAVVSVAREMVTGEEPAELALA